MQTKRNSHIEIMTNQFIGIIIWFGIVYFLFPLFDHMEQLHIAVISTLIFSISSYVRAYYVRRIFNKK